MFVYYITTLTCPKLYATLLDVVMYNNWHGKYSKLKSSLCFLLAVTSQTDRNNPGKLISYTYKTIFPKS
jgi:hypothetical protein